MTYPLLAAAAPPSGSIDVFGDVVVVLATCVGFGLVAQRLRQSVLVGYLLAGVVLGSQSWLGIVQDIRSFSFMGEVGVALLLFTVGLDLPVAKVRRMASTAVVAGGLQCLLTTVAATSAAVMLGVAPSAAIVIGAAIAMSSTAVVLSVLADRSESDSVHGLVTTGVLIAQDVIVVLVLLLVPLLPGADGASSGGALESLAAALAKLLALIIAVYVVERIVMRRIFQGSSQRQPRELLAVASLTVSLGAIGACWALALSPALGGFVAGIVMADAAYAAHVRSEIAPIRMGLMAIFFAYVGMLADAAWMLAHLGLIMVVVAVLVGGKALITWSAARLARVPRGAAVMSAVALAQLGEFSFATMTLGVGVGVLEPEHFRLLVSASLMTMLVTPGLISFTSGWMQRRSLAAGAALELAQVPQERIDGHAIVIGMGPAGGSVAAALSESGVQVVVVELNPRPDTEAGDMLDADSLRLLFGDASRPEVLQRAGIAEARILVVTVPDPVSIRTIIAQSRQLAPDVPVVARGRYHRYVSDLAAAGAGDVVDEEHLTGVELAQVALRRLVLSGELERRRAVRRQEDRGGRDD